MVAAVIKRGGQVWEYKVEGVTADNATLTVRYPVHLMGWTGARKRSTFTWTACLCGGLKTPTGTSPST